MPDDQPRPGDAEPWGQFELAVAALTRLRSRHYRISLSLFGNTAGVCESDRHRWPCHASILLDTLVEVIKLTRDDDKDLPDDATITAGALRAALARALLTEEAGDE